MAFDLEELRAKAVATLTQGATSGRMEEALRSPAPGAASEKTGLAAASAEGCSASSGGAADQHNEEAQDAVPPLPKDISTRSLKQALSDEEVQQRKLQHPAAATTASLRDNLLRNMTRALESGRLEDLLETIRSDCIADGSWYSPRGSVTVTEEARQAAAASSFSMAPSASECQVPWLKACVISGFDNAIESGALERVLQQVQDENASAEGGGQSSGASSFKGVISLAPTRADRLKQKLLSDLDIAASSGALETLLISIMNEHEEASPEVVQGPSLSVPTSPEKKPSAAAAASASASSAAPAEAESSQEQQPAEDMEALRMRVCGLMEGAFTSGMLEEAILDITAQNQREQREQQDDALFAAVAAAAADAACNVGGGDRAEGMASPGSRLASGAEGARCMSSLRAKLCGSFSDALSSGALEAAFAHLQEELNLEHEQLTAEAIAEECSLEESRRELLDRFSEAAASGALATAVEEVKAQRTKESAAPEKIDEQKAAAVSSLDATRSDLLRSLSLAADNGALAATALAIKADRGTKLGIERDRCLMRDALASAVSDGTLDQAISEIKDGAKMELSRSELREALTKACVQGTLDHALGEVKAAQCPSLETSRGQLRGVLNSAAEDGSLEKVLIDTEAEPTSSLEECRQALRGAFEKAAEDQNLEGLLLEVKAGAATSTAMSAEQCRDNLRDALSKAAEQGSLESIFSFAQAPAAEDGSASLAAEAAPAAAAPPAAPAAKVAKEEEVAAPASPSPPMPVPPAGPKPSSAGKRRPAPPGVVPASPSSEPAPSAAATSSTAAVAPVSAGGNQAGLIDLVDRLSTADRRASELAFMVKEAERRLAEREEQRLQLEDLVNMARGDLAHIEVDIEACVQRTEREDQRHSELEAWARVLDDRLLQQSTSTPESQKQCGPLDTARSELSTAYGSSIGVSGGRLCSSPA